MPRTEVNSVLHKMGHFHPGLLITLTFDIPGAGLAGGQDQTGVMTRPGHRRDRVCQTLLYIVLSCVSYHTNYMQ